MTGASPISWRGKELEIETKGIGWLVAARKGREETPSLRTERAWFNIDRWKIAQQLGKFFLTSPDNTFARGMRQIYPHVTIALLCVFFFAFRN